MYKYSDAIINSTNGWKKNSGIICASAIGMAAIVLNDAGSTKRSFKPKNWFNRANGIPGGEDNILMLIGWGEDGIEDNFFIGDHGPFAEDVPQSSPGLTATPNVTSSF
jgi:D-aminopeptidase